MVLAELRCHPDEAFSYAYELGRIGAVQFRDLNPNTNAFDRHMSGQIKEVERLERRLRYFEKIMRQEKMRALEAPGDAEFNIPDLESEFRQLEMAIRADVESEQSFVRDIMAIKEEIAVLNANPEWFSAMPEAAEHGVSAARYVSSMDFVMGVVNEDKFDQFQSLLFRTTRGKIYMRDSDVEEKLVDPTSGKEAKKKVFLVLSSGSISRLKIQKICESFNASVYPRPENLHAVNDRTNELRSMLDERQQTLDRTRASKARVLDQIRPKAKAWRLFLARQKATLHILNMWRTSSSSIWAQLWYPKSMEGKVEDCLAHVDKQLRSDFEHILKPIEPGEHDVIPTYFPHNKFTAGFQQIVDSYGVPCHGEVNPGVFTIVTFPFLFAVMFGDYGHAILMTIFSLLFIAFEKRIAKANLGEIIGMLFNGRYVLLMMGIWSIYTGFMYNDFFALSFDFFGSVYPLQFTDADYPPTTAYAFGIDPCWYATDNKLNFYNSYKMKMAVILGVSHMLMGTCAGLFNHLKKKAWLRVFFEFIPEFLFLFCTFGYMCIMIFVKWNIDWHERSLWTEDENPNNLTTAPPSLLIMMTQFFLGIGAVPCQETTNTATGETTEKCDVIYPGQSSVQTALLLVAVASVPVLLLVRPLVMRSQHKRWMRANGHAVVAAVKARNPSDEAGKKLLDHAEDDFMDHNGEDDGFGSGLASSSSYQSPASLASPSSSGPHVAPADDDGGHVSENPYSTDFSFGDVMIHQMIHSIEYVLGAISNTASYLRLWALSLAHAQLSEVFWEFVLSATINMDSTGLFTFVGFAIWAGVTFGVLLMMEALSAFLHALRLHWVEFQNKFYVGDGVRFSPFSLKEVEKQSELEIINAERLSEE